MRLLIFERVWLPCSSQSVSGLFLLPFRWMCSGNPNPSSSQSALPSGKLSRHKRLRWYWMGQKALKYVAVVNRCIRHLEGADKLGDFFIAL
jgi:hypothetical protein